MELLTISLILFGVTVLYFLCGIRILRPTERGVIETLGKYSSYAEPGVNYVFPGFQSLYRVNTKEKLVPTEKQLIITKDKLNAEVNAQVYFRVGRTENDVKSALYNPEDYEYQIVQIAKTTLRNIIGTLTLTDANSGRNKINSELMAALTKETSDWGITIVRTELAEIDPPKDVQATMNKVVIAEKGTNLQMLIGDANFVPVKAATKTK